MENVIFTGYNVAGLTVQVKQGDVEKSLYMPGLNLADFEDIKAGLELGGEFVVSGFSLTVRDKKVKDGTLVIPAGSAEKYSTVKVGLKRTADIGGTETDMKTLYVPFLMPEDKVKQAAVVTHFVGKTIAGAKVVDIIKNETGSYGA